ncbi:MAG: hypothetical protein EOO39_02655 [Cytophagaceae bacterium]|nr:MAG: hypothetical protein EOO39_02655 [Cytophagaceae bacterium]
MYKSILFVLLGLATLAQAQEVKVITRAGRLYTQSRAGAPLVPLPSGGLPTVVSTTQMTSMTTPELHYNSSTWKRKAGNPTADNVLIVSAGAGYYYERQVPDKELLPELYGAFPDDNVDDGQALLAWLNAPGSWTHQLPAGVFKSSIALVRPGRGAISLAGAGSGKSIIQFTGNTNGIQITNPRGGTYGSIDISGIGLHSVGAKSAGREGLLVRGQHDARYKHSLKDVAFVAETVGNEWTNNLHIDATSFISYTDMYMLGASYAVTDGVLITNETDYPCVEHTFYNLNTRTVKTGMRITGSGLPAIEGVKVIGANIVGAFQGIVGYNAGYGSPDFSLTNVHINVFGGQALALENFSQISFTKCLFYVAAGADGTTPARAVYIKNAIDVKGEIKTVTFDNTPDAVVFDGSGGNISLDVTADVYSAQTNAVRVATTTLNYPDLGVIRNWNGNATWGTAQGLAVAGHPEVATRKVSIRASDFEAPNKSLLEFNTSTGLYEAVSHARAAALTEVVTTTATSVTVNPATTSVLRVYNDATDVTIVIDAAKAVPGQVLYIYRGDEHSTGLISIQTVDPTIRFIQQANGSYNISYSLPTTSGKRSATFLFSTSHLTLLNGG